MTKAFLACKTHRFNETQSYMIPIQQELFEHEGSSEIKIEIHHKDFFCRFDQYLCHHDFMHKKNGKVFGQYFNHYFEPLNFYTYYNETENLTFIQTKTDAALDFVKRLNLSKHYNLEPVKIDFTKMYPLITEVAGAWIADLKRAHLKTAGFFGPNVHKSEEFIEAASEGNVSSIQMKFISDFTKEEYSVAISKRGTIVLYDTFDTIEKELDLVNEVFTRLIKPHL
jgi:hypothetical protein